MNTPPTVHTDVTARIGELLTSSGAGHRVCGAGLSVHRRRPRRRPATRGREILGLEGW